MSTPLDNFSILIVIAAGFGAFVGLLTVLIVTMLDLLEFTGFPATAAKYRHLLQSLINRLV